MSRTVWVCTHPEHSGWHKITAGCYVPEDVKPKPETEKEARERKVWKQEKPACTCTPVNPRHRDGWQCITSDQLVAWASHHNVPMPSSRSDKKRLAFMWLHFSQDPEAKRLSGRDGRHSLAITSPGPAFRSSPASLILDADGPLGGDRWDDDAGMTEIQKEMFP